MKKLLISIFIIFGAIFLAHSQELDSLISVLNNSKHDTTKCRILNIIIESVEEEELYNYNQQLKNIVEKNIKNTELNKLLKREYLIYKGIYLTNEGYISDLKSEFEKAINYYQEAIDVNNSIEFYENTGFIMVNKGNVLNEIGKPHEAIQSIEEAINLFQKIKNKKGIAFAAISLAYLQNEQGNVIAAIDNSYKGLKIYEELEDNIAIAATLNNIATFHKDQEQYQEALKNYIKAQAIIEKFPNKYGLSTLLGNIGQVYRNIGENQKALDYYHKASEIQKEIEDRKGYANTLTNIAGIYKTEKKYKDALKLFNESLEINKEIKYKKGIANNQINIGQIYFSEGRINESKLLALNSMELAQELGNPDNIKNAALLLKKIYIKEQNLPKSIEMYDLYISMRDSIENENYKNEGIKNMFKYQFEKKSVADSIQNAEHKKVLELQIEKDKTQKIVLYTGLLILILFGGFIYNRLSHSKKQNAIIGSQKAIVEKQKLIVEAKNHEITQSIQYAQKIQSALLPNEEIFRRFMPDSFIIFKPKDIVSGDFYWLSDREDYIFYATADSTGHGVPGGFMSMLGTALLNEIIDERKVKDCGEVLTLMREKIMQALKQTGDSESKDGMDMVLIRIDKKTLKMEYAAANNSMYIVGSKQSAIGNDYCILQTENCKLYELPCDKMPVGVYHSEVKPFQTFTHQLSAGDTIYTYTDGYADQFGGENGKKYTYKRLREKLIAISEKPLAEQRVILESDFEMWKGENEQIDDVCLIGVRV